MDQALYELIVRVEQHLGTIAQSLQALAGASAGGDTGPNFYRPSDEYPGFDWSSIGASVVQADDYGAARVSYQGREYKRRTHPKFGQEIWFSRGAGRDEEGNVSYVRLITFSAEDADVEPLPEKIAGKLPTARAAGSPMGPMAPSTTSKPAPATSTVKSRPAPSAVEPDPFDGAFPRDAQGNPLPDPEQEAQPDEPEAPLAQGPIEGTTATSFWREFYKLEREQRIPQGLRDAPEILAAKATGNWDHALRWLREMQV